MSNHNNPKNTLQIIEWQSISSNDIQNIVDDKTKAEKIFDELKKFASEEHNHAFITIIKAGKALKARNYVGLIQTKSGFCLEILPKINDKDSLAKQGESTKTLLVEMLKTLRNFPAKASNFSNLNTSKTPLLEIFIQMFLNELIILIKKGIKSNYQSMQKNRFYLKGKLLFSQHIKHNLTHQERFYTSSDEYSPNIPQNRLIKSTLELFSKISLGAKTQSLLRECYFVFNDIPTSENIDKDFNSCHNDRSLKYYKIVLLWCKVFLRKQNFAPYGGNTVAIALLFDMNYLFESYVAHHLKSHRQDWDISAQDRGKYLLQNDFCALRPDIVATKDNETIILDTKWKKIESQKDIAVSDIYQMWAYVSKYKSEKTILLYPKIGDFQGKTSFVFKPNNPGNVSLEVAFVDLTLKIEAEIKKIFEKFQKTDETKQ
ncbi:hypothetical protein BKH42_00815 [Helicobacter sp. 13S00482-2]|uniref:McrC family protein n=1 Tax=Helicobacter sp. 13S00482-2 TaxID=1476200 RepID=UPI000BA66749|nr:McrC family protein [Helicobacter sp. 13S00482-2]PAF54483.1 hypothetical protein BKH42_00815 [Helicobacter sp. 13S00482-2]